MNRITVVAVIALTLAVLVLAIMLPGGRSVEQNPKLPWVVTFDEAGWPRVFGITIGKSTLAEARQVFEERGITNLFVSPEREPTVETYFQNLYLSGIKADLVVTLDLQQTEIGGIYNRGLRISQLESGAKKVQLSEPDLQALAQAAVGHITYIPAADLDAALILSRFGEPAQRIAEPSGIEHWLYPEKGLDIALNPDGKEVFQYIPPARFDALRAPLAGGAE